jgi:SURF1 family
MGLVLVPVAMAILLSLGTWQVNRLHWKESLLASIDERSHAPAVDVSEIGARLAAGEEIMHRRAAGSSTTRNAISSRPSMANPASISIRRWNWRMDATCSSTEVSSPMTARTRRPGPKAWLKVPRRSQALPAPG